LKPVSIYTTPLDRRSGALYGPFLIIFPLKSCQEAEERKRDYETMPGI